MSKMKPSTNNKVESTGNVPPKKKIPQKKEVAKTPESISLPSKSPTRDKAKIVKEKKDRKTINLIIKKSFTYIDSSASFGFFDKKEPLRKIVEKPPIPKPRLTLSKGNKPVNPINPVKEVSIPITKPESEEKPKVKKAKPPPKPKKEWDDNFNSPKKDEAKMKKVNFKVDPYREMVTQALATSAKKLASDREKLKRKYVKEFPMKDLKRKSSLKSPPADAPIKAKVDDVPIMKPPEEIQYQPIEVDKSNVMDKLRTEVAWNLISKLFIKKEGEAPEENRLTTKHRWNLKSGKRKRVRASTEVDASSDGKFFEDSAVRLKRHNTEPHSYRGFIWRHPRDVPNDFNDYSVTSLKHLNTDDLEDFVFWESVPPKSTSCWEVSLYQSKRPWSVLSCSVFRSNRMSSTPGLILENLRNGRSCENRVPSTNPLRILPRSNSFDVEPSIAQKNIDIRNWVAALNFDSPEPNAIMSERNLNDQEAAEKIPNKGMHHLVPSDCTLKEKKPKMKHEGKKTPGKRARSAFDDTKMQLAVPPADNMRLVSGVYIGKEVKVIDYDKKNNVVKSLLTMNPGAKDQKCVYMVQVAKNKSASDKIRKSRDGRKSRETSRGKSKERVTTSGGRKRDDPLEGLVRKGSGGFVTVEQFCTEKRPETRDRVTFHEKIMNLTDLTGDADPEDPTKGTLQVAEPSGEKVHKHECELINCCVNDFKHQKEDGRKAAMEYGKLLLNKRLEMEAKRKARASSRARSRNRGTASIFKIAISHPLVEKINSAPSKVVFAALTLLFCVLSVFYGAELIRLVF